jgi:Fur family ferric uptake transcriptional regulator
METDDSRALLRSAGLRVTAQRVAALQALDELRHVDTDGVVRYVRSRLGAVSTQAVYDVLAAFVRVGLARRVEPGGRAALYELRTGDHHHLICRSCGVIEDVPCAVGRAPCLRPAVSAGFRIEHVEVTWWGLCGECQLSQESSE